MNKRILILFSIIFMLVLNVFFVPLNVNADTVDNIMVYMTMSIISTIVLIGTTLIYRKNLFNN